MTTSFKTRFTRLILPVFAALFFFSCQKDLSSPDAGSFNIIPDLATTVNSSVSGFVTDENNAAVKDASVLIGGMNTTTDKYGFFEIKNANVVKDAAVVTVSKTGYFKGIKTYSAVSNKAAFFRIKLIPKVNVGTIGATAGGNVSLSNGLIVALPANGVVVASSSAAYTGTVNVAAHWIDPTAADLNQTMPGDLRGINTAGAIKMLTSYGMVAVELTGASGELLQIAAGKKATLTFPIPASIVASAPSTIPLWSFDETKGLWKEEGTATKTGNTYVGDVSHFSFWNCDVPANYVQFDCTVKDQSGNPVPYAAVKISVVGGSYYNARYGFTDSSGYVHGLIPDNAQLLVEIFSDYNCGTPVYSQNLTTSSSPVSLGDITITTNVNTATVSGTVTDCSNNPIVYGYVFVLENNLYTRYTINPANGTYNFTRLLCNSTAAVTLIAEDLVTAQQSAPQSATFVTGPNTIANIQACGTSVAQFITWSVDGAASVTITPPADSLYHNGSAGAGSIAGASAGATNDINFGYDDTGMGVGTTQVIYYLYATPLNNQNTTIVNANALQITEYGAIGEFISGNFNVNVLDNTTSVTHTVVCSFRVRRTY